MKRRTFILHLSIILTGCLDSNEADNEEGNNSNEGGEQRWRGGVVLAVRLDESPENAEITDLSDISDPELRDTISKAIQDAQKEERELKMEMGREPEEDERLHGSSSLSREVAEELDEMPSREGRFYDNERYIRYEGKIYAVGARENL